jgi:hypothetical protein
MPEPVMPPDTAGNDDILQLRKITRSDGQPSSSVFAFFDARLTPRLGAERDGIKALSSS